MTYLFRYSGPPGETAGSKGNVTLHVALQVLSTNSRMRNHRQRVSAFGHAQAKGEWEMVQAVVMTDYGPPEVLVSAEVKVNPPGVGQILVDVGFAGVGPTDLEIRSGHLKGAFGATPGSVLGFEAAGVVNAVGDGVSDVRPGDAVAVFLPELGGYAAQVLARYWVRQPDAANSEDAAALPASAEAAARVVEELSVADGQTLLIVGGAGSVGLIATQLAVQLGARVLAAVRPSDFQILEAVGATPVAYGRELETNVRAHVSAVDAVIDASGTGVLAAAVHLAGGPDRVVTLSDPHASDFGVRLSGPDGPRIAQRLDSVMALLAGGQLRLRPHRTVPLTEAAAVHRDLESRKVRAKVVLAVGHNRPL